MSGDEPTSERSSQGESQLNDAAKSPPLEPVNKSLQQQPNVGTDDSIMPEVSEAIGAVVCGGFAGLFFSTDHIIWGIWFTFGTIVLGLLPIASVSVKRFRNRSKLIWVTYSFLMLAVAGWFFVWSRQLAKAEDEIAIKPHLDLLLLRHPDDDGLRLTNDFLLYTNSTSLPEPVGHLVFPMDSHTNIVLSFAVENNSAADLDGFQVEMLLIKSMDAILAPGWYPLAGSNPPKGHGYGYRLPFAVLRFSKHLLPLIALNQRTMAGTFTPIYFRIRAKGAKDTLVTFWVTPARVPEHRLYFSERFVTNGIELKRLTHGTNEIFILPRWTPPK
jgi:hypothetical protein